MNDLAQTIRAALSIEPQARGQVTDDLSPAAPEEFDAPSAAASLAPLVAQFLTVGGDERITVDPKTGRNRYGTSQHVAPGEIWFSSSTATGPSVLGQRAMMDAIQALITDSSEHAASNLANRIRARICGMLGRPDTHCILVGSGTEAEILALSIGLATMGDGLTNIVVAPEETGSGVLAAAAGQHFLPTTSLGGSVEAGARIEGLEGGDVATVTINIRDAAGKPLSPKAVDAQAAVAVERALTAGRNVILHVLDCSKTGLSGVSRATARALANMAPGRIMVVVDACQLRCEASQVQRDLADGFVVLITGSKFAAGPPFSGAVLLPPAIAARLAQTGAPAPRGLATFSSRVDWPDGLAGWAGPTLTAKANTGLLLRWSGALCELDRYHAIDAELRTRIVEAFARTVRQRVVSWLGPDALDRADNTGVPSIVCVTVARGPGALQAAKCLHERLRTAEDGCLTATSARLLARVCHVGQPVQLGERAVLRIAASAPLISHVARRMLEGETIKEAFSSIEQDLDAVLAKWNIVARDYNRGGSAISRPLDNQQNTSLDPKDWDTIRDAGVRALDLMIDHLSSLREQPVWRETPDAVREQFRAPLPQESSPLADAIDTIDIAIKPYATGNTHPMFMGWVHGGGTPVGMIAELLAAGLNANCGGRDHVGLEVERQVVLWAAEMLGLPPTSSGILVTGTSMANFLAVLVARDFALGHHVRNTGLLEHGARLVAYTSTEAHGCISQALELAGIGSDNLRLIATDARGRMDSAHLKSVISADRAAGLSPFLIVGTAGSVNTGAVDLLDTLADIARREQLWFHVDAAFGAMAALAPSLKPLLNGISEAHSVAFDFHKWGQVPYDAGILVVRDAAEHKATFASPASYLARLPRGLSAGDTWPCDLGPDLSRSFRALKVWLTFSVLGADSIGAAVERCCRVARHIADLAEASGELEARAPVALNIACIGLTHPESDRLVPEIVMDLHQRGVAAPSVTTIDGRPVIRAAIVNHRTTEADGECLIAEIEKSLARLCRT